MKVGCLICWSHTQPLRFHLNPSSLRFSQERLIALSTGSIPVQINSSSTAHYVRLLLEPGNTAHTVPTSVSLQLVCPF
jgi:hypothetical protein